ncbi:Enoyl-CoA hydratase domain-containing protein 3, mitochondrial [Trachymyrmex septentrionalis]|uniref:Enoyl-CoA hydratase domain-containing protein 3, mitochondrial n=1 Tax=Trachymyrmex septentrionalis TaxID=34720 RepID=A0A195F5I5_9HYME|nr:Enoyl-CoA hydratase domain-containing protein 3, mitochondrial [Trachymyrmex septentrionalis]
MIVISRFVTKNGFAVSQGRYIARTLSTEKKYVQTTEKNGVRTICLCDSSTRNSLSLGMLKTLVTEIKRDEDNKDLRSIVLMSEQGKVFSAGHNLKELTATNAKSHKDVFEICSELMRAINQSPVPVIAAVDGLAAAAGCQLVAAANVGIFCSTPGIPLVRNVPRKNAMYMLFTGFSISGKEAYECGLVSKVVANDKLDEEIHRITEAINIKSRSVVHFGKTFLYEQITLDISTAYALGTEKMVNNLKMKDAQEGIQSFLEKRKPNWSHDLE